VSPLIKVDEKSDAMSVARNTVICRRNEKGKA